MKNLIVIIFLLLGSGAQAQIGADTLAWFSQAGTGTMSPTCGAFYKDGVRGFEAEFLTKKYGPREPGLDTIYWSNNAQKWVHAFAAGDENMLVKYAKGECSPKNKGTQFVPFGAILFDFEDDIKGFSEKEDSVYQAWCANLTEYLLRKEDYVKKSELSFTPPKDNSFGVEDENPFGDYVSSSNTSSSHNNEIEDVEDETEWEDEAEDVPAPIENVKVKQKKKVWPWIVTGVGAAGLTAIIWGKDIVTWLKGLGNSEPAANPSGQGSNFEGPTSEDGGGSNFEG